MANQPWFTLKKWLTMVNKMVNCGSELPVSRLSDECYGSCQFCNFIAGRRHLRRRLVLPGTIHVKHYYFFGKRNEANVAMKLL